MTWMTVTIAISNYSFSFSFLSYIVIGGGDWLYPVLAKLLPGPSVLPSFYKPKFLPV